MAHTVKRLCKVNIRNRLTRASSVSSFWSGNFWIILQHCETWHFSTIWLVSLEKMIGSSFKWNKRCIFGQESSTKLWKSSGLRISLDPDSGSWLDSLWWKFVHSLKVMFAILLRQYATSIHDWNDTKKYLNWSGRFTVKYRSTRYYRQQCTNKQVID